MNTRTLIVTAALIAAAPGAARAASCNISFDDAAGIASMSPEQGCTECATNPAMTYARYTFAVFPWYVNQVCPGLGLVRTAAESWDEHYHLNYDDYNCTSRDDPFGRLINGVCVGLDPLYTRRSVTTHTTDDTVSVFLLNYAPFRLRAFQVVGGMGDVWFLTVSGNWVHWSYLNSNHIWDARALGPLQLVVLGSSDWRNLATYDNLLIDNIF